MYDINGNLNAFIRDLDKYLTDEDKKKWVLQDKYEILFKKYENKSSSKGFDMLTLTFIEKTSNMYFSQYLCYGHPEQKVKNIAARRLKDLFTISGTNRLDNIVGDSFVVNIKIDDHLAPRNFEITKYLEYKPQQKEEIQF